MELEEIFQSGWEVCLSPNAFVLSAPSKPEAFNLAYCKPEALAEWALRFGRGATLIKYPQCGDFHYRIPAAMANPLQVIMNSSEPLILDPGNEAENLIRDLRSSSREKSLIAVPSLQSRRCRGAAPLDCLGSNPLIAFTIRRWLKRIEQ